MKLKFVLLSVILILLCSSCAEVCNTKKAPKPDNIRRLLETKRCPGCEFGTANFQNAQLLRADLRRAELASAVFDGENLTGAEFTWTHGGSFMSCVASYRASFVKANLSQAKLTEIGLYGVNLSRANLRSADLSDSTLSVANLEKAQLIKADLSNVELD